MKYSKTIQRNLEQYVALSAAFLVGAQDLNAEVIYTDVDPDRWLFNAPPYDIDLNNDGNYDFRIRQFAYSYDGIFEAYASISAHPMNTGAYAFAGSPLTRLMDTICFGESINWPDLFHNNKGILGEAFGYLGFISSGVWADVYDKYIGVRFELPDGNHYGWIRCDVFGAYQGVKVRDYAFETQPGVPIVAGDRGVCDITDAPANLNSTVNPVFVTLGWDPINLSEACRIQGTRLSPPGPTGVQLEIGIGLRNAYIPVSELGAGTTWEWAVQCACTLSPIDTTPYSSTDTFSIPVLRREDLLVQDEAGYSVFPNPSSTQAMLQVDHGVSRELPIKIIRSTDGKLIDYLFLPVSATSLRLDVSTLPEGKYLVQVGESEAIPMVIQR